jgi:hypothetical protein
VSVGALAVVMLVRVMMMVVVVVVAMVVRVVVVVAAAAVVVVVVAVARGEVVLMLEVMVVDNGMKPDWHSQCKRGVCVPAHLAVTHRERVHNPAASRMRAVLVVLSDRVECVTCTRTWWRAV